MYQPTHQFCKSLIPCEVYVYVLPSSTITSISHIQQTWSNGPLALYCTWTIASPDSTTRTTTTTTPLQTPLIHKSFAKFSFPSFAYIMYLHTYTHGQFYQLHIYICIFVSVVNAWYTKSSFYMLFLCLTVYLPVCHPDFGHIRRFMIIFSLFCATWGDGEPIKGWGVFEGTESSSFCYASYACSLLYCGHYTKIFLKDGIWR